MQARAKSVGRGGDAFRGNKQCRSVPGGVTGPSDGPVGRGKRLAARSETRKRYRDAELAEARAEIERQAQRLAALEAEAERARAEARELAARRQKSLSALCHDLRTPLNAVIGFSDVMQRELHGPLGHQRYRDYAAHIRESGALLLQAAEQLLCQSVLPDSPPAGESYR